ncbi:hypothetical protein DTQ70_08270 [Runella sp. SP2]|nr:hypothetical protein DTQ70_08270 [Runella sp. SP2]
MRNQRHLTSGVRFENLTLEVSQNLVFKGFKRPELVGFEKPTAHHEWRQILKSDVGGFSKPRFQGF